MASTALGMPLPPDVNSALGGFPVSRERAASSHTNVSGYSGFSNYTATRFDIPGEPGPAPPSPFGPNPFPFGQDFYGSEFFNATQYASWQHHPSASAGFDVYRSSSEPMPTFAGGHTTQQRKNFPAKQLTLQDVEPLPPKGGPKFIRGADIAEGLATYDTVGWRRALRKAQLIEGIDIHPPKKRLQKPPQPVKKDFTNLRWRHAELDEKHMAQGQRSFFERAPPAMSDPVLRIHPAFKKRIKEIQARDPPEEALRKFLEERSEGGGEPPPPPPQTEESPVSTKKTTLKAAMRAHML